MEKWIERHMHSLILSLLVFMAIGIWIGAMRLPAEFRTRIIPKQKMIIQQHDELVKYYDDRIKDLDVLVFEIGKYSNEKTSENELRINFLYSLHKEEIRLISEYQFSSKEIDTSPKPSFFLSEF